MLPPELGADMRRRKFISLLGGAGAWPLAARAQQTTPMRRVAVLLPATADNPDFQARVGAFLQGRQEAGWSIGRNMRIDTRWAGAMPTKFADTLRNWSRSRPTSSSPMAPRPSALAAGDPNGADRVPDGRRSGRCRPRREPRAAGWQRHRISWSPNIYGRKWLELLKEIAPDVTRVALFGTPPGCRNRQFGVIQAVAPSLRVG